MSYSHMLVSAVQDRELKTPEDWNNKMFYRVEEFALAVKRALRLGDIRFAGGGVYGLAVYRPQDKYVIGSLSVMPEHESNHEEDYLNMRMHYGVRSRTIENKRYSEYNSARYTRSSTDMKKAVKLAVANLRPYKPVEVAQRHGSKLEEFVERHSDELRAKKHGLIREVTGFNNIDRLGSNDFEAELRHLVRSGHSFINPELGEKVAAYFQTKDLQAQAKDTKHDMVYLRVYTHNNQQLADIATVPHDLAKSLQYTYASKRYMNESEQVEGVPVAQLSDNLIGRVSVLSMLQVEQGEPGIGYKASDDEFFIYPEPEVADA